MIRHLVLLGVLLGSVALAACGDDSDNGVGGEGGEGMGAPSTGGGCASDPTEPNSSIEEAVSANEEDEPMTCDTGPVVVEGALADEDDFDVFRFYTDSTECDDLDVDVRGRSGVALDACLYAENCDDSPVIERCPDGMIDAEEVDGMRGCCGPIGGIGHQAMPDILPCGTPSLFYVSFSSAAFCSSYELELEL